MKTLKNDKMEMVKLAPDDFKVFVKIPAGTSHVQLNNFIEQMKVDTKITAIPKGWEVIVIRGNGTVDKL